jgi:diguanylate cyclase (GGDEF)-like protein/PAS domain S-box-containing protein
MNNKDFYKFVLNGVKDGVYFVDKERKITFWNKSAEGITGFEKEEVLNHYCFDNILNHVDDEGKYLCKDGCPLHETLVDGKERSNTVYLHHKDGHRVESKVYIMPIFENGEIIGAVETFSENLDEAYLKKNIEKLKSLAYYDQLTSLPNRRYLDDQLAIKLEEYKRMKTPFAVAILDIDHFKMVNDTYGHDVGDMVLKMLAKVFQNAIRGTDFIGRWGGEEFVAVFTDFDNTLFEEVLNRLRMLVERSTLRRFTEELKVTISIGGAIVKEGESLETLFSRADKMLYRSKEEGRNRVSVSEGES